MWSLDYRVAARAARFAAVRFGVIVGAASLLAGCFQPLYGSHPSVGGDSVKDKLAEVQIAPIPMRQGTPQARLAVGVHNALQFDLTGGAGTNAPTHRLDLTVSQSGFTVLVDPSSGRPTAQVAGVQVTYQLVEIATGKVVLQDTTFTNVDYDAPGSEQRFAVQRAQRDAEDRAVQTAADTIRNRLASYFVAGT
jgi:LPS-assembly lipoprotein